jgi:hypothetical protein
MPKKRVGVSLRKPSPARDSTPPTSGEQPVVAEGDAVASYGATAVALEVSPEAPSAERAAALTVERTAATPPEPVAVDAFVTGAAAALEKAAQQMPPAKLQSLIERGPEGYRELVLYLPEPLAQRLSLHCLEHDVDMSRLVAAAIEKHLESTATEKDVQPLQNAAAPAQPSAKPAASESLLSMAARALLAELGEWVRLLLSRRRGLSRAPTPSS